MEGLKQRTIRGGAAKLVGPAAVMLLAPWLLVVLARLLDPSDFGLVAMVTVVTGVFDIFVTGGLSAATVQKGEVTPTSRSPRCSGSTLLSALLLGALCVVSAPLLVSMFITNREPATSSWRWRRHSSSMGSACSTWRCCSDICATCTLSSIEVGSQVASAAISIGMALAGFGYWALVASVIAVPACVTIGAWLATGWIPGPPRRDQRHFARCCAFGGTITLNGLVVYAAYNLEKVLLGRYFGSDALGLYGRAYQLVNMPTQALNVALGGVAFAALARLQGEPARFKSYFLKGYSLVVSMTLPTTIFCAVLADDIILVVLGPKWREAASIFRLLAPTILVFGIINPLGWLLQSIGLQERSLKIAFVIAPLVCFAYLIGIPYGPNGVALRLLGGDVVVAHPACPLVPLWHADCADGPPHRGRAPARLRPSGRSSRASRAALCWRSIPMRSCAWRSPAERCWSSMRRPCSSS